MFKPAEFSARFPSSQFSEIENYVDACLRRGQLRIIIGSSGWSQGWSQSAIKAVHARYVEAGWSVELQPCPGVMMQFHNPGGGDDEVTKP